MVAERPTAERTYAPPGEPIVSAHRRGQAVVAVIMALLIVAAAWVVGGRAGFDQIGRGGINRQYMPKVGDVAPELLMIGPEGAPVRLSDFRGQPVWVNFWGSWCPPCRAELPDVQAAYEELAPRGVVLIALSIDQSRASATEYARANGGTFPVYNVPSRALIAEEYDLRNVPTHMFIDDHGVIRAMVAGSLSGGAALAHGEALLAPAVPTTPAQ
ncbi:MAG: TlpA family protein disulfide reductase [Thermomicrobiales bacterium]